MKIASPFHSSRLLAASLVAGAALAVGMAWSIAPVHAHGDMAPQPVDTKNLPKLNGPLTENPYRDKPEYKEATEIGASAFNQNCARCHGIEAKSGGIAPDLRYLPVGKEGDEYFQMRIRNGVTRNGAVYMPAFGSLFSEEAIWSIRSYLDSVHVEQ